VAFELAACAEMLFFDLPFVERVRRLTDLGFQVEIWGWPDKDIRALRRSGATFSSMTGYVMGTLSDPDGAAQLLAGAAQSLAVAEELGCPRLNLHGTGLGADGLPLTPVGAVTPSMWLTALRTLESVAALGSRAGRVFTLENLNVAVDHPGTPFSSASEVRALVEAVDSPHLRMNLDLYHAQIGEGNLASLIEVSMPFIGEVQVADVPGRREPGTGEINYRFLARRLGELGYDGVVGLEGWASETSELALERFRSVFTDPGTARGSKAATPTP
jgi:hydroxypyruvate isomerase